MTPVPFNWLNQSISVLTKINLHHVTIIEIFLFNNYSRNRKKYCQINTERQNMRAERKKLSISIDTTLSRYYFESCKRYINDVETDPQKDDRTSKHFCKYCYYKRALAGQAFTNRQCAMCPTDIVWGNTNVPILCVPCAKKLKLCAQCGGDIDGKNRQKDVDLSWRSPTIDFD